MRLYRRGDEGEPVRDIQARLGALGHHTTPDVSGLFGPGTEAAVQGFQTARGLPADGIVGPDTWRTLVRAGYRLGDRLLYHRVPKMHGDDIAELQRRLNALGFDAGKIDGVFGADTLRGLIDFQVNRRMAEDGIAGHEVVGELDLMARATDKPGREGVRERQWLADLPPNLIGQRVYVDAFCRTEAESASAWRAAVTLARILQDLGARPILSRSIDTAPTERVRAVRANRLGVDLVVSFALPMTDEPGVFYFASSFGSSAAGARIAKAMAARVDVPALGRSVPILKDTRPPAVVIAVEPLDEKTGGMAAQGMIDLFALRE